MPVILTSIHDPAVLAVTCRRLGLDPPQQGACDPGAGGWTHWIIRSPGVLFPIVCDTLTGVVTYHPRDNAFRPYSRIMAFVHRYYAIRARLRRTGRALIQPARAA
jgi:hypothetical protein